MSGTAYAVSGTHVGYALTRCEMRFWSTALLSIKERDRRYLKVYLHTAFGTGDDVSAYIRGTDQGGSWYRPCSKPEYDGTKGQAKY